MTAIPTPSEHDAAATLGITTTVPVEVVYAAGLRPVDLNNLFITSGCAGRLVAEAETEGFPRNFCAWTKGIYATARRMGLRRVLAVVQGDCSNAHAMAEVMKADGMEIIPFSYPHSPEDRDGLTRELARLAERLGTTLDAAEAWKRRLDPIRALANRIDELAWRENRVTGEEQHVWTISCSDFAPDPDRFKAAASAFIAEASARSPFAAQLRVALVGIPPICEDFFRFMEGHGARVVFNEIPRQFAMPHATDSLVEQYTRYTYPYEIFERLRDIEEQIALRKVDAVVHYVQSFCHRQVQDAILRRHVAVPFLTLEGDRPGRLDMRTETRLEAFLEMLREDM